MMRNFALFIFILLPFAALAEQPLGEVRVSAEASEAEGDSAPARALHDRAVFTTVITSKQFEGRRADLPEILEQAGGVQIRRYGGLDTFATVSIRGSTTEQVDVYLDGLPLSQGLGGVVNIAAIPTDQIERIEIYKGSAPAWFGTSSIGGVVNLVTKKTAEGKSRTTKTSQSYGSFDTCESSLTHGQRFQHWNYDAGYTFERSRGDFTYLNNNGTSFNTADDRILERINNEFARHNVFLKYGRSVGPLHLRIHNRFLREDRGIPGLANLISRLADLSTTRNEFSVDLEKENIRPGWDVRLMPFFQYQKVQFSDPAGEIGLGLQNTDDDTVRYGVSLRNQILAGRRQRLQVLAEYRGEQFLPEDFSGAATALRSVRNHVSLGLEDAIFLFGDRLVLTPSVRTENVWNRSSAVSPSYHPVSGKMGILYRPLSGHEKLTVKSNAARSYRVPNFSELFGNTGSIIGNPALKPESGWNADAGVLADLQTLARLPFPARLEVSYYFSQIGNLIQLLQTSQFTVTPQNLTRARIHGIETVFSCSPVSFLKLDANYTFQRATDASGLPGLNGKFLPGRPRHDAGARATVHAGPGRLFSEIDFIGGNFLDTQNLVEINRRLLWNAGASVRFLKRFIASVDAKNLLNQRVSDVVGFPLPGRSFYGKVEVSL